MFAKLQVSHFELYLSGSCLKWLIGDLNEMLLNTFQKILYRQPV